MTRAPSRLALWPLLLALGGGLGWAVLSLPPVARGLGDDVHRHLEVSGVESPVTAVLLNFRSYDTLLEIAVLALAAVAIWSVATMPRRRRGVAGPVLVSFVQVLVPFMVLLAGYLLWSGSHAEGGAFQAGVVLAAAALLVILAGAPLPEGAGGWPLRAGLTLGLLVFLAVGALVAATGRHFLEFPPAWAGGLILLIEAAAALSIGCSLALAFRGGRPRSAEPGS